MKIRFQDGYSYKNLLANVFVVLTILRNGKCSTIDPCVGVQSLWDTRRNSSEDPGACAGICDINIRDDWYRFDASNSPARMPESSVEIWQCGTHIPIWLKGGHPTVDNPGPLTLNVCAQLRTGGSICEWQNTISVMRCYDQVEYFIYKLKPTPFCDMAYCAGKGIECPNSGSWNDITKSCNLETPTLNVRPTLSDPYISSTKTVTDNNGNSFTATRFSMKCTLNYARQTVDNGARYDVSFQSNGQVLYTKTLKSTDLPEVEMSESYLVGRVGQTVTCKVASYWQSAYPTRSPYQVSNAFTFDIYFVDANNVRRTDLPITESTSVKIYVKASFIITTPWCFNLPSGSPCYPYYTFLLTSSNLLVSVCTFRLAIGTQTSGQTSGEIWVSSVPDVAAYGKSGNIYFQTDRSDQNQNSIFGSYTSSALPVMINDPTQWPSCMSAGDPHIRTFDPNTYYHVFLSGDFVLLEVPSKDIQIHVRFAPNPGGSTPTWNCGVIAREGNNVLGINSCGSSTLVERYLYDETNPGGNIRFQGGSKWIITLPSGIRITADVYQPHMDINVEGDGVDIHRGLCSLSGPCYDCVCWDQCDTPFRVSGSASLFSYSRDNPPPCLNTKPPIVPQCSCQNGVSPNRICTVPDNTDLTPSTLDRSKCRSSSIRRKRESSFVTEKPKSYQASQQSSPLNVTWPTKSGIYENDALAACNSKITQSGVYNLCVASLQVNATQLIQQCVLDIQLTDDKDLTPSILANQMEVICKYTIDKAYNGTTSSEQQQYVANVCPRQCSQNGKCNNGKCACNKGYMSDDCSIQKGQVPVIQSLAPPTCDVRHTPDMPCPVVRLYATGVSSDQLVCQIKYDTKVIFLDMSPSTSGGLVTCKLPQVPVNPGIAFSEAVVSYTVYVSISNDATSMKFSNEMKFIIYDGLCVTCDVSSGCQNTRTACNILGRCYENSTVMYCGNNNTDPRVCNPAVSNTKWLPINSADASKGSTTCSSSRPVVSASILLFAYIFIRLVKEKYMQPN